MSEQKFEQVIGPLVALLHRLEGLLEALQNQALTQTRRQTERFELWKKREELFAADFGLRRRTRRVVKKRPAAKKAPKKAAKRGTRVAQP